MSPRPHAFHLIAATLLCAAPVLAQHDQFLYLMHGQRPGDQFGICTRSAGDVNGDGIPDVIVGAPLAVNNGVDTGSAYVYSGKDGTLLHQFNGDASGDQFGNWVCGVGDMDRDGFGDVAVGAWLADAGGHNSGQVKVFSGRDGHVIWDIAGTATGDTFGFSIAGGMDVDRDGFPDLIVGAPFDNLPDIDNGSAIIFSGRTGAILRTFVGNDAIDYFGWSVDFLGDVDQDGWPDVIVGAPRDDNGAFNCGSAYVYSGQDGHLLFRVDGDGVEDRCGISVSRAGDVNHDGFLDFFVGIYGDDNHGNNSGAARLYSGRDGSIIYHFDGDQADDEFGITVHAGEDVDGDGYPDMIVGAFVADYRAANAGMARVFSGRDGTILQTFYGNGIDDEFGISVAFVGDIDRDGLADFAIGAEFDDSNGTDAGSVRVISGACITRRIAALRGAVAGEQLGAVVVGLGDVNHDGIPDFAASAPLSAANGAASGRVRIVSGADRTVLMTLDGVAAGDRFGAALAAAGDVDSDGVPDLIVGAPYADPPSAGADAGMVYLISGATGAVLNAWSGAAPGDHFGAAVAGGADLDQDGRPDVLVGAPDEDAPGADAGAVYAFSGRTGELFQRLVGTAAGDRFGTAVAFVGDCNGDSTPDFAVGAPGSDGAGVDAGSVVVVSGSTWATLFVGPGLAAGDRMGSAVAPAGDVDGDGRPDVVGGAPLNDSGGVDAGSARVWSGASGATLLTANGDATGEQFGSAVAFIGDIDRDGVPDFLAGAPLDDFSGAHAGRTYVVSGRTGALLVAINGEEAGELSGSSVASAGDVDRDGVPDLLVGAPAAHVSALDAGSVRILSVALPSLETSTPFLSLSTAPSVQTMELRAGRVHARKLYFLLGTMSGSYPGTPFGTVTLPINVDAWTFICILTPNRAPYLGSLGFLDANGEATARFAMVPGLPVDLVNVAIKHAYLIIDPATFSLDFASNPTVLTFVR